MKYVLRAALAAASVAGFISAPASGAISQTWTASEASGLGAVAVFTFDELTPNQLSIQLCNTSTGVPSGFSNSDQILTSVAFRLGGLAITGGTVRISAGSASVNFSTGSYGPGADVSGEWGYGNGGTTGLHPNFVSANVAGTTGFGGANLDGPANRNGPQGGLIAAPALVPLGGLGAIQNCVDIALTLSGDLSSLDFLSDGVRVEFGSDAAFVDLHTTTEQVPAPGSALLALGALAAIRLVKRS